MNSSFVPPPPPPPRTTIERRRECDRNSATIIILFIFVFLVFMLSYGYRLFPSRPDFHIDCATLSSHDWNITFRVKNPNHKLFSIDYSQTEVSIEDVRGCYRTQLEHFRHDKKANKSMLVRAKVAANGEISKVFSFNVVVTSSVRYPESWWFERLWDCPANQIYVFCPTMWLESSSMGSGSLSMFGGPIACHTKCLYGRSRQ